MSTPDDGQPDQYGRPPASGQGYGPAPGQGYGPAYGPGYPMGPRPDHPQATTSMVLGILGLVLCTVIAPFAWRMGRTTLAEIDASGGQLGGRGQAQAGYVCGLIGTVLLGISVAVLAVFLLFLVVGGIAASTT